jgi:hypothetical protein
MSVTSTFEAAFLARLTALLSDASIVLAWSRLPQGAPVSGVKDVALFYAPGGDRESAHDGVAGEEGRVIQFSIFSPDPQDVKNASKALHYALEGAPDTLSPMIGDLTDGSHIYNVTVHSQDYDQYDNDEKVYQTVFEVMIRLYAV